jgi:inner membrane protein
MKKGSVILRLFLVSGLIIVLLIPLVMIQSLIGEREFYREKAVNEVNRNWSGTQVFGGPVFTLESQQQEKNDQGRLVTLNKSKHILPDKLFITSRLIPEVRYKGIYEVVLYKASITASGTFYIDENGLESGNKGYFIFINLSDLRGIEDNIIFKWNGKEKEVTPGIKNPDVYKTGVTVNLDSVTTGVNNYEVQIKLKGSEELSFLPIGKSTIVTAESAWNTAGFFGDYLPSERSVSDNGFKATWKVNYFNRAYPQNWTGSSFNIMNGSFGVRLMMPVDEYQKSMRSAKYGILIILLTFVSFFMIELFSKKVIHPVQYLLVGLSLVIFYAVLVALSEYILFSYAYLAASVLVMLLIALYVKSIYSSGRIAVVVSLILMAFYSFIYILLQLEDLSLLLGTMALFIILAVVMYLTRRINWFEIFEGKKQEV